MCCEIDAVVIAFPRAATSAENDYCGLQHEYENCNLHATAGANRVGEAWVVRTYHIENWCSETRLYTSFNIHEHDAIILAL